MLAGSFEWTHERCFGSSRSRKKLSRLQRLVYDLTGRHPRLWISHLRLAGKNIMPNLESTADASNEIAGYSFW